jgi:cytochrome c553
MRLVGCLTAAAALAACGPGEPSGASLDRGDAFSATGELIALSGGEAGATNACHTCHGLDGQGDAGGAPRIAGLPQGYLVKQLQDYAEGRRRHAAMHWIASRLSPQDRQAVSAWYASRPSPPAVVERADSSVAERLWLAGDPERDLQPCALCHGARGEGGGRWSAPPVHDQPPPYLAEQLRAWRRGERQNSPQQVMLHVSRRLTEPEIAAVSRYAAALPGAADPLASAADAATASSPPERRPDR